jgi:uncharacterized protein YlxP (DUF503 family)
MELKIPGSHFLKDKRQVLTELMQRLKRNFNLSLCEVGGQDSWQHSPMELTCVETSQRAADETCAAALCSLESRPELQILSSNFEVL